MTNSTHKPAVTSPPPPSAIVEVAVGIVVDKRSHLADSFAQHNPIASDPKGPSNTRILITRRRDDQVLAGYWELPGGKIEPSETPAQAAIRELKEEVGITVSTIAQLPLTEHQYEHAYVRLHPFICQLLKGTPSAIDVAEVRWVQPEHLQQYPFPQASLPIIHALLHWLANHQPA